MSRPFLFISCTRNLIELCRSRDERVGIGMDESRRDVRGLAIQDDRRKSEGRAGFRMTYRGEILPTTGERFRAMAKSFHIMMKICQMMSSNPSAKKCGILCQINPTCAKCRSMC
uniref:Uncharacterized protein n=1 Tax=Kalanchoe fedtschenkoi TaxID=63787 RepID=A0A7N0TGP1_KALFE